MNKWIFRLWIGTLVVLTLVSIPQCLYTGASATPEGERVELFNWQGQQSAFDPQGPIAQNQLDIFYVTLWVTLFLFVTVGGALAWVMWRYRAKATDDPDFVPPQSHGNPLVEIGLVVASTALLVVIAIPTFGGIVLKKEVPAALLEDAIEVNVMGYQWWWAFEYTEEGFYTANEIVFPAGRAVKLNLRTDDVLHSFWIPKLAGKTDLIAGQENFMWIKADEPGYFWGQCAEFCGDSHAYMLFRARALSPEDWEQWKADQRRSVVTDMVSLRPAADEEDWYHPEGMDHQASLESVLRGASLFQQHCLRCHSLDATVQTSGPNLAHFAGRTSIAAGWYENTPEELFRWIKFPNEVKPGNNMWRGFMSYDKDMGDMAMVMEGLENANLTDQDTWDLVAYLYSLR